MIDRMLAALCLPVVLASCAAHQRIETGRVGQLPVPAGIVMDAQGIGDPAFARTVEDGLRRRGFSQDGSPKYRVEVMLSHVPGKTGLFAPSSDPEGLQSWTLSPAASSSTKTYRAVLTMTDITHGQEIVRVFADERMRRAPADYESHLAEALLTELGKIDLGPVNSPAGGGG